MSHEFNLKDDDNEIRFVNTALGKETIYFNGELVSDKRVIFGGGAHKWSIDGSQYELLVCLGRLNGKIELLKDSKQVDIIEGKVLDIVNKKVLAKSHVETESDSNDTIEKSTNTKSDPEWSPFDEWWGKIAGSVLFAGIGIWLHFALMRIEASGESIRVNWFIALAYKVGGRFGAVALCAVLSVAFLFWGIRHYQTKNTSN
ncbi:MAG: hypothetical protein HN350_07895 [Phycisphaerales bacterium]|jgi:hypothetical protein|nr:hypothetical protein [Phycisphaerales bacterium]